MKQLLVTGGCGFIGSHFIKQFLQSHPDWKVHNLDKLTYCGSRENTRSLEGQKNYQFIHGDVCDPGMVFPVMENSQLVVHFAAETHVDRSIDNADDFLRTNILGTRVLLEAARRCKVQRFVHISTDEVYGSIDKGAAAEDAPLLPNSPYSASKASADLLARSYWKTYQVPVVITRSSNNYGPNQFPEKVIPLFITNLLEGKKVPLYGDGRNQRDWIYVEDNCRAIQLVAEKGEPGEIYNIGAGKELTNLVLTQTILKEMGAGQDSVHHVEDRLGHDLRYAVDTSKIKNLGFSMKWNFDEGLRETIAWYRKHEDWWKPLKKDKFTLKT
jgi:dTDP-glucose 4,6-dehydratase